MISLALALPIIATFLVGSLQYFVSALVNILFSVRPCEENSHYYSAIPTKHDRKDPLPPVIIQLPVYLESLQEVIIPTLNDVYAAAMHYKQAGGSAKIFVNDDGLQIMLARGLMDAFNERMKFYNSWKHILCVVARPPSGRRGHFKKASNMNFCLRVARSVTEMTDADPTLTPQKAREELLKQVPAGGAFIAGGDLRMHPDTIILLIDSDTRMNKQSILQVVPEFMAASQLGYGQCITSPFSNQRDDYFQRMVWDFTYRIYHVAIKPDVARGHIPPLVGHNAFLSWRVMNACKRTDEFGDWWWSENHVSEDFDLSMRMMAKGFIGRYITYTEGFEEGISLTFPEEEKKVVKFAYGAAEMLFNPFRLWLWKGPISPLFRQFIWTKGISFWSKLKMLLYLLEYFGVGFAPIFSLAEAGCVIFIGNDYWTRNLRMIRSFDVTLFTAFIFTLVSPLGSIAFTFRARLTYQNGLLRAIWDGYKYSLLSALQWSSYSYRFLIVIIRYFCHLPIPSWGSTSKEQEEDVFADTEFSGVVVPIYGTQMIGSLLFYSCLASLAWLHSISAQSIFGAYSIAFAYAVGPIVLNPNIMRFRY